MKVATTQERRLIKKLHVFGCELLAEFRKFVVAELLLQIRRTDDLVDRNSL